jgi:hypothetical protein
MNKDMIQNIFIGVLLGGVILLAGGVYYLAMQVQTATQGIARIEEGVMEQISAIPTSAQLHCEDSGGMYSDSVCSCSQDFTLEKEYCVGPDGSFGGRMGEEMRIQLEKKMMMEDRTATVNGLTFDLPSDWSVESQSGNTAKLRVPDPAYQVLIPFTVNKLAGETDALPLTAESLIKTTASGVSIYSNACAPTLLCRILDVHGDIYEVVFEEPESNEKAPDNLDGPWFPSTTVTEKEMEEVIESVR